MAALKFWTWLTTLPGLSSRSRAPASGAFPVAGGHLLRGHGGASAGRGDDPRAGGAAGQTSRSTAPSACWRSAPARSSLSSRCRTRPTQTACAGSTIRRCCSTGAARCRCLTRRRAIAVVGTRSCTPYGVAVAEEFGYEMAKQGALVVSGMARGIDAAAQRGALRAGGLTAAVLGGGVDVVYPAENRRLYEDIAAVGVLLSEYPPGTEPAQRPLPRAQPHHERP